MKKLNFCLIILTFSVLALNAQSLKVGLRDNQFAQITFIGSKQWLLGYEQSLLNVKLKEQNCRLYSGYLYSNNCWDVEGIAYYGFEYDCSWQTYGFLTRGGYKWRCLSVIGALLPHYDSGLGFDFCYQSDVVVSLWERHNSNEKVELVATYGNIPEYRMAVDNIRIGLKFQSGNLWVKPLVYLPIINQETGAKYIRFLCSFEWIVNFGK